MSAEDNVNIRRWIVLLGLVLICCGEVRADGPFFSKKLYGYAALGDAVLQLIISKYLFSTYSDYKEGYLSREKQSLVSKKIISKISLNLAVRVVTISLVSSTDNVV